MIMIFSISERGVTLTLLGVPRKGGGGVRSVRGVFQPWRKLSHCSQLFTDDSLMMHFHSFEQRIMFKNLKIISINNIKTFQDIAISHEKDKFAASICHSLHLVAFSQILKVLYQTHKCGLI